MIIYKHRNKNSSFPVVMILVISEDACVAIEKSLSKHQCVFVSQYISNSFHFIFFFSCILAEIHGGDWPCP